MSITRNSAVYCGSGRTKTWCIGIINLQAHRSIVKVFKHLLDNILEKLVLRLENLACPVCAQNVGAMLNKTKGVEQAEVFFNTSKAKMAYDAKVISPAQIIKAI